MARRRAQLRSHNFSRGRALIRRAVPGPGSRLGGKLIFSASDATNAEGIGGESIWSSDGTASGTIELQDFPSAAEYGVSQSTLSSLTVSGESLYFVASIGSATQLWVTDGTVAGTRALTESSTAPGGMVPSDLTSAGGRLFFLATASSNGGGSTSDSLWVTSGTVASTLPLTSGGRVSRCRFVNGSERVVDLLRIRRRDRPSGRLDK